MIDQLSAYLDYELPESERTAVRDHLRRCPECENELATLRAAKQLLADVPVVRSPRSFVLSVEQADALKARPVPRTALAAPQNRLPRLVLGLRLAASAVFVLALLIFGTDLLTSTVPTASPLAASQTNQGAPAAGRVATAPTFDFSPASAAATSTTAPAVAMGGAGLAGTAASSGAADTTALTSSAPVPPPVPSVAAAAANSATGSSLPAATSLAEAAAPTPTGAAGPSSAAALAKQALPTAEADQVNPLIAPHTEPGIIAAPPAAPPPGRALHLLPWELGLGLLALLLITASIFLPRQDS